MTSFRLALVGGGVRSGKSAFALALAATLRPPPGLPGHRAGLGRRDGGEDRRPPRRASDRLRDHRGAASIRSPPSRARADADVVLLDCLTLWLSNLLVRGESEEAIGDRVVALADALREAPFASIVVTNEVGMGIVPESPLGRTFRDVAGRAHQAFAARADRLYFAMLGTVLRLVAGAGGGRAATRPPENTLEPAPDDPLRHP